MGRVLKTVTYGCNEKILEKSQRIVRNVNYVIFQKGVRGFQQVSKREKQLKPRGCRPSGFIVFWAVGNQMKPEARVFEITPPTKKISLNFHLNKCSQFRYYIQGLNCA